MGNFSRRKSHLQVLFNLLLSNNILKICHTSPSFLLFCLTSGENIQQKPLDFSYFIQNGKVVLLVLHQLLCKLVQIFINQPDNTVYSVPSPFIQKILSIIVTSSYHSSSLYGSSNSSKIWYESCLPSSVSAKTNALSGHLFFCI